MTQKPIHLLRGAPGVRSWSKYQTTVEEWTLCGIHRQKRRDGLLHPSEATEDASLVSCPYCHSLMGATVKGSDKGAPCVPGEA